MSSTYKLLALISLVLITILFFSPSGSANAAISEQRLCQLNFKYDYTIDNNQFGLVADIRIDNNCIITVDKRIVSTTEAQKRSNFGNKNTSSQYSSISKILTTQAMPSILAAITTKTCHSYIGVLDPVNIELTGLKHHTTWDYDGTIVGLRSMSTDASWHYTTGWSKTAGPTQWVVDGNGGSSDKTHGEASYKWTGGLHAHTLKAENTVRSNGTCTGTLWVVGTIPTISHTTTSVWVN